MKQLFLLLLTVIFCGLAYSQTAVLPGDGTLSAALAAASDGAVLQLSPGGLYTENIQFLLDSLKARKIMLLGRANVSQTMPKVTLTTPGGTRNFFLLYNGASLKVKGIEFDGTDSVAHLVQCVFTGTANTDTMHFGYIIVDDCEIHHLTNTVIEGAGSKYSYTDSVIVNNTIMHDSKTTIHFKAAAVDYLSIKNSTFYRIRSYGLRIGGPGNAGLANHTTEAVIDHTTWNDITKTDERQVLLCEGGTGANLKQWTVKNSIIANQSHAVQQNQNAISLKGMANGAIINNMCFWDLSNPAAAINSNTPLHIVADTISMNPQFKDTANGDFTIQNAALPKGADGLVLGDTRWGPRTAVDDVVSGLPREFSVDQNFPNPFNPTTSIRFSLPRASNVSVKVFTLLGQEVASVFSGYKAAGVHTMPFNAAHLGSGVYFYKVEAGKFVDVKKMVLVK
ncbi:MAG: DUF4957 domain-containing protein [Ignavibacteriae bacterium]|nr:MAG: DUF4957 domain-containing protein [Ignavibacteriota bacterium]